ncbi:MAG: hypothetical protein O2798_08210 [Chloroflexi bacterium]|nr:hypothetical protein [Chloroflexota bacterium]
MGDAAERASDTTLGLADYDVVIGAGGCSASAVVTIAETVTVTASGQLCQRVWVDTASPPVTACDTVTYTTAPPPTAIKQCVATSTPNLYTCTLTITPAVATGPGPWLVQMVTPGPGTFASTSTVSTSTTGCSTLPTTSAPGSLIGTPFGIADYDVVIGAGGCNASASVVITESVTVTASGQICQRVWVTTASPYMTACDSVVFTPVGLGDASAEKSCVITSVPNV